jgi:hypothetical protein
MSKVSQIILFILFFYTVRSIADGTDVIRNFYFWGIVGALLLTFIIRFIFARLEYWRTLEIEEINQSRLDRFERMKRNKLDDYDRLENEKIHQN